MSDIPEFKVGDEVEWEITHEGYCRWSAFDTDRGGCGEWVRGVVVSINKTDMVMTTDDPRSIVVNLYLPAPQHRPYVYRYPGYLRHVNPAVSTQPTDFTTPPEVYNCKSVVELRKKCDCPIEVLMGGCKCGGV
jgi:hypothetical protein